MPSSLLPLVEFPNNNPFPRHRNYPKSNFLVLLPAAILQRTSVSTGRLKIQGVATCLFLCMDRCGLLYGSVSLNAEGNCTNCTLYPASPPFSRSPNIPSRLFFDARFENRSFKY
ncbi:hypothetical protein J437_LFUL004992 [Ladona fulva]|uniref:Uncharacterized protein n=1 Tax=Ladona fulva TaxID=123851 RepID=A0A8K0NYI1_LADFU|nr:hypothetical protein J437_LFUL004992 [Ladona fulva]